MFALLVIDYYNLSKPLRVDRRGFFKGIKLLSIGTI